MLGISRWTGKGGSYRTVQRLYNTILPWSEIFCSLFCTLLFQPGDEYILAGDEVVVSKAGYETYGKDCIFSSMAQRPIPALAFFAFSLINVRLRRSSPIKLEQVVRSEEEKAACKAKAQARKTKKKTSEKRKPGRPKGSKNKNKQQVELNPELKRISKHAESSLRTDHHVPVAHIPGSGWPFRKLAISLDGHAEQLTPGFEAAA